MLRNFLAATLRNMARNRLFSAIVIGGLTVAFAAAILIALFVYDKFHAESHVPGADRVYLLASRLTLKDHPGHDMPGTVPEVAAVVTEELSGVRSVTRRYQATAAVRARDIDGNEDVAWVDPNFFTLLKLPVLRGDPAAAVGEPGSAAITAQAARKYFGTADPIGQALEINRADTLRVAAVLEDPPAGSTLNAHIYVSARAASSPLARLEATRAQSQLDPVPTEPVSTYVVLDPGYDAARFETDLAGIERLKSRFPQFMELAVFPVAMNQLHLHMPGQQATSLTMIAGISLVGLLILLVAGINYINLMTARAGDRAREIGIRKVVGADRKHLVLQFMGESTLFVLIALLLALALVELLSPLLRIFLFQAIGIAAYPPLLWQIVACALLFALLAGVYPALVMSSFRPQAVLKSGIVKVQGAGTVRQVLVALQFAFLIAILIGTFVMARQIRFATHEVLKADSDQVVLLEANCSVAFADQVRQLPGVAAQFCSSVAPLAQFSFETTVAGGTGGVEVSVSSLAVDFDFFGFYGIKPLAGRLLSSSYGADQVTGSADAAPVSVVVNERGMRRLGFTDPQQALGWVSTRLLPDERAGQVVGVVPDFLIGPINEETAPIAFYVDHSKLSRMAIKLTRDDLPGTMAGIERAWRAHHGNAQFRPNFLQQVYEFIYRDAMLEWRAFAAMSIIALVTAGLGLLGLSIYNAQSRTREIGVRKAMGASRFDVSVLLGSHILKPVLVANLLAWPAAWFAMRRWLDGFVHHVDMTVWMFVAGSLAALFIGTLTVFLHAWHAARANPSNLLRYE